MRKCRLPLALICLVALDASALAAQLTRNGEPAQLDVRPAGEHAVRVTMRPLSFEAALPWSPTLVPGLDSVAPALSLREVDATVERQVGALTVIVRGDPLTIEIRDATGARVQELVFADDGTVAFEVGGAPVLGMGEGGPQPGQGWRTDHEIELDRRGRFHEMRPRWQSNAYGSRNPVALLVGTDGWALYVATPWVQVDLTEEGHGTFIPWRRPEPPPADADEDARRAYIRET
ncbi:MAG TPA: hypothetical protein VMM79_13765, partial [Longimicrobiales bacterium]|nr:hypothetical protein [Longimicrobiales bacterium]